MTSKLRNRRLKKVLFLLFIFFLFHFEPTEANSNRTTAFVKRGAFLLSTKPCILKNNKKYYGLTGYLPIGTVVYYQADLEGKKLFSYDRGSYENYIFVDSDIGISGLLREDLKVDIDKEVLIPVANQRIPIQTCNSKVNQSRKLSEFSRSDGVYLVIIGNQDPDFYDVELPWTAQLGHPPDRGRLWKRFVEDKDVILISPDTVRKLYPRVYRSMEEFKSEYPSSGAPASDFLRDIAEKVRGKVGENMEEIHHFLENLDSIKCMLSSNAHVDLGIKIFGAGLGLNFSLALKKNESFYEFGELIYCFGDKLYKRYIILKDIKCKTNSPYRLVHFMLQEYGLDPKKRALIWAEDIDENLKLPKCSSLQGAKSVKHMFKIDGYASYNKAFCFFEEIAREGEGFLSTLTPYDRTVIINMIIREIGNFRVPRIR